MGSKIILLSEQIHGHENHINKRLSLTERYSNAIAANFSEKAQTGSICNLVQKLINKQKIDARKNKGKFTAYNMQEHQKSRRDGRKLNSANSANSANQGA